MKTLQVQKIGFFRRFDSACTTINNFKIGDLKMKEFKENFSECCIMAILGASCIASIVCAVVATI